MIILSKNNALVKEFASLKDKKTRRERGAFLVEGAKMVRECAASGLTVRRLVVREDYEGDTFSLPVVRLGADAFRAVCDEKTPQGIAAEVALPRYELRAPEKACIFLDGVADPANVGAAIRTAVAAGYCEIYCSDCADPYSPKSVRASMSGVFFARIMEAPRGEVYRALDGVPMIAADMSGENVFAFTPPDKFALCVGNEGSGLSESTRARAQYTVRIPMGERTESLNAAVSAGIIMYELKRNRFINQ